MILYAIPTPLGGAPGDALPVSALEKVRTLESFVVENQKSARAFLSAVKMPRPLQELSLATLDEHTAPNEISSLLSGLNFLLQHVPDECYYLQSPYDPLNSAKIPYQVCMHEFVWPAVQFPDGLTY